MNKETAVLYSQQLHPAFAGYLYDGEINDRDALATILYMLKHEYILPKWQGGDISKELVAVTKSNRNPQYDFEKQILQQLFETNSEIPAKEVGEIIKRGEIKNIIANNLEVLAKFPIINNKLKFKLGKNGSMRIFVNGQEVDTVEKAKSYSKILTRLIMPIFIGIGILLILIYTVGNNGNLPQNGTYGNITYSSQGDPKAFLYNGAIFIVITIFMWLSFKYSKKSVTYDFANEVVPIAKEEYTSLYQFLKNYPLDKHRFTNEFLEHSVAFGQDNTWQKDFGLDNEIVIDESPVIQTS